MIVKAQNLDFKRIYSAIHPEFLSFKGIPPAGLPSQRKKY